MKNMLGSSLCVLILVFCQAWAGADGQTSCQRAPEYANLNGFCIIRDVETCSGTDYHIGCIGTNCSLCVLDTSICLEKPVCTNANGDCVKDLAACDRLINEQHCHGDGCACCKDGCQRQPACKTARGYCLLMNQTHLCTGTQFNLGCLGTDCFCCVPDTSICIEKNGCLERNGYCLKERRWSTCDKEVDSYFCLGDNCACCRETECVRSNKCRNMGGYCYRKKSDPSKQHICNGSTVSGCCGGVDCMCCVPNSGK